MRKMLDVGLQYQERGLPIGCLYRKRQRLNPYQGPFSFSFYSIRLRAHVPPPPLYLPLPGLVNALCQKNKYTKGCNYVAPSYSDADHGTRYTARAIGVFWFSFPKLFFGFMYVFCGRLRLGLPARYSEKLTSATLFPGFLFAFLTCSVFFLLSVSFFPS